MPEEMGQNQYAGNGCMTSPPDTTPLNIAAALPPDRSPSATAGLATATAGVGACGQVTTAPRSRGDSPGTAACTR
jgi:hypothetical protein